MIANYKFLSGFLLILDILSLNVVGFDYCTVKSCLGEHTMCLYPSEIPPFESNCSAEYRGMSREMREVLVTRHNELRSKVAMGRYEGQPSASNMMVVKWNNELELIAQRWASQCHEGHDKCRNTADGVAVGQNAQWNAVKLKENADRRRVKACIEAVDAWFSEGKDMPTEEVDKFTSSGLDGKVIGHYTEVVWAKTSEIGCGMQEYKVDKKISKDFQYHNIYCNYKPSGNYLNVPVYTRGKPCRTCPTGTHCSKRYPGLCTDNKKDRGPMPSTADHLQASLMFIIVQLLLICG